MLLKSWTALLAPLILDSTRRARPRRMSWEGSPVACEIQVLEARALLSATVDSSASASITAIDVPGSVSTRVTGISGDSVAGIYQDAGGQNHGFLFDGSAYTSFDVPGLLNVTGVSGGNVIGSYQGIDGRVHAFLYDGSTVSTVDFPGADVTNAVAILGNRIVGNYLSAGDIHSYLYDGSTYLTIDPPGSTFNFANGVSSTGVTGFYTDAYGHTSGFLFDGSSFTTIDIPGSTATVAAGLAGNFVFGHYSDASGRWHGFLSDGTSSVTVDVPGAANTFIEGFSGPYVVGTYDASGTPGQAAAGPRIFVYDGSTFTSIDLPGATLTSVVDVSGNSIVGTCTTVGPNSSIEYHSFLCQFTVAAHDGTDATSGSQDDGSDQPPAGDDGTQQLPIIPQFSNSGGAAATVNSITPTVLLGWDGSLQAQDGMRLGGKNYWKLPGGATLEFGDLLDGL